MSQLKLCLGSLLRDLPRSFFERLPAVRASAFAWLLIVLASAPARAANDLPPGFSLIQVGGSSQIEFPVGMAFAPDGRIFVTEQKGAVRVIKNNQTLPAPFATLNVHFFSERGMAGICFDPNFVNNGYVYIYYTAMTPTIHNRLSRFTAAGDVAVPGSELVLIDFPTLGQSGFHNSGCVKFGRDGKLYVSVGENNVPTNSQSLYTPLGKILRINADGTVPSDNPFYNQTTGINRSIYAMGFRNPFTFDFQPGTGRFFVNDVGYATWEDVKDVAPGGNYGWPIYEGVSNDPNFKSPIVAYIHPPDPLSSAITGGAFYNPETNQFPANYVGKYFFMDGFTQWIRYIDLNTYTPTPYSTNLLGLQVNANYWISEFATNMTGVPLYLTVGPDGCLYYVAHIGNAVFKIQYSGQLSPQIGIQPGPQYVSVGYPASFSVQAYGAESLAYIWQRKRVGDPDYLVISSATNSTLNLPTTTLADNGALFRCTVSNLSGSTNSISALLTVTANQPPGATIATPPVNATFKAGDTLSFSGGAIDNEDGTLPPSALTWWIDIHHLTHTHPFLAPTSGFASNSIAVPNLLEHDDRIWLRLHLVATDSTGLSNSIYRDILPVKSTITLATQPPGMQLRLDGASIVTPPTSWPSPGFTTTWRRFPR
jgi:glucose/arabinose dehydrogenase